MYFKSTLTYIFILVVASPFASTAFAQNSLADSLELVLKTAPKDTQRVNLLVDYAWELMFEETDASRARFQEAIALAENLSYKKGLGAAWNGIGNVEEISGDFEKAENSYKKALDIRKEVGYAPDMASTLNNLGLLYEFKGEFEKALKAHQENLRIVEEASDTLRIARAHFNIAGAYQEMGLYPEAQTHLNDARLVLEAGKDQAGIAKAYTLMGHIRFELDRYTEAKDWYSRSLKIRETLDDPSGLADALNDYGNALDETDSSELAIVYYTKALGLWEELEDEFGIATAYVNLGDAHKHLGNYELALNYLDKSLAIRKRLDDLQGVMEVYNTKGDVLRRMGRMKEAQVYTQTYFSIADSIQDGKYIQRAYKDFSVLYAAMGNYKVAYDYRVRYDEFRYARLNEQIGRDFARKEALFADQKKQQEIERQEQALKLQDAKIAQSLLRTRALIGGAIALALIVVLLYNRNRIRARANKELAAINKDVERERQRADDLLVNILPSATAAELKANNRVKPKRYDSVTVLFSDFKNFTLIAEQMQPEDLVHELDEYFRLFDGIVDGYGLEKIKTIGDAYMCAGGLPEPSDTHPQDVVRAAIDMQRSLKALMLKKEAEGKPVFEMRIGIHTGPVVAGIVGSHKFAYDIWGDTVNTAARLEQGSEAGKINVSETTYQRIKDIFPCTFRGELRAKNKGAIAMYFVLYGGPGADETSMNETGRTHPPQAPGGF
jgi:class 3 adenylate cyclase